MAELTDAQTTTFHADINANAAQPVIDARAAGDNHAITDWYNLDSGHFVFKRLVPMAEVSESIELDDVANMTSGDNARLEVFYLIRLESGTFCSLLSERDGWDDIFSTAAGDDTQQALIELWKREANELERLFVDGSGVGTTGDPDGLVVDGFCSVENVQGWES